ncbi:GGDEF domain-containing protein [Catenovulum sp. SM1970]|uniref:GGDEF domain-containing protein n=1 Tax=Marinifaba aquimaris TaxID=2741323 RepID=UPI001574A5B5|nr:GGDEF domain-containing protein [Marinifaba aquimaris]NTS76618.1 GGDEF domain-containing protein [Marinifaba aquimaris]
MELKRRDSIEQAKQYMLLATELLKENELACDPNNYAVAYEIVKGNNSTLASTYDKFKKTGRKIDNYCLEQWSQEFMSAEIPSENNLLSGLDKVLVELKKHVSGAGGSVEGYLQKLDTSMSMLNKTDDGISPNKVIKSVVKATHQVKTEQVQLKSQLDASQSEAQLLRQELNKLQREAVTDALTGLANRRGLEQYLQSLDDGSQLSLMVLDIDHFKGFNDTFGHLIGDVVLAKVADQVNKCRPKGSTAVRFGGEEFILITTNEDVDALQNLAETVRTKVESMKLINGKTKQRLPTITVSLGIAVQQKGEVFEQLLSRADNALYQAKDAGRNRVQLAV